MTIIKSELAYDFKKTDSGKIKIKVWGKSQVVMTATFVTLFLLTIYGFLTFDYKGISFMRATIDTLYNLKVMFLQPAFSHFTFADVMVQLGLTLGLGFLSTILGAVLSLFIALFAAKNLSTKFVSNAIIVVVTFIRAVPTVLWVLIFAIAAGLGSEAVILGMVLHSIAFLVKAYSESFEEIDDGIIEALRASGANWWHIVTHAVIPSTASSLLSWTFLRFETNFTVAVAMGAAAGAGGIGFELLMASGFYFDLREVGFITYAILIVAIALEVFSTQLKKRFLTNA
ncbi:PhnE/PtxC family ABC transporter permease [Sporosarcina sp. G11-34]|uniref:PhnE/PtxC family ABC transporter permease n=1 Tax=Sporosarcina sp. G11-34 TaxID=2849605 RepID=UPI0022A99BA5|nr:ABC transporter permease subunit [Sporosarcina sp. G11-34]MCZ2259176.1 ABC transporter permease subunit [Sporosarcina sp. G11-34]